ncbi:hypothetical protein P618_200779 [Holospora obtusa F1]|uniref:DUF4116 domain-containing protein n=1 Tax=Holospora obtusa F1 TaxID=1399147 RepID=W6TGL4_HOLOB|nr:hypothetical protein [Holospora obtusa]ETZ07045.1 hypothetical protein P618_200779 [Holospora obtusa F1]
MKKNLILLLCLFVSQVSLAGLSEISILVNYIESDNLNAFMKDLDNPEVNETMNGSDWAKIIAHCIEKDKKAFFEIISANKKITEKLNEADWTAVLEACTQENKKEFFEIALISNGQQVARYCFKNNKKELYEIAFTNEKITEKLNHDDLTEILLAVSILIR